MHRGTPVDCSKIVNTALLTIEGEKDDISGLGQTKAARRTIDRWLPVLQEKIGEDHPYVSQALVTRGLLQVDAGQADAALETLLAADRIVKDAEPKDRALLDLGLGLAMWPSDPEQARNKLEAVAKLEGPLVDDVAERARTWLAEHAA